MAKKFPKAKKKPGNPPRRVPGRKQEIKQLPNGKWSFQFKRNDYEDMIFDTQEDVLEYAKEIRLASIKATPLRVKFSL